MRADQFSSSSARLCLGELLLKKKKERKEGIKKRNETMPQIPQTGLDKGQAHEKGNLSPAGCEPGDGPREGGELGGGGEGWGACGCPSGVEGTPRVEWLPCPEMVLGALLTLAGDVCISVSSACHLTSEQSRLDGGGRSQGISDGRQGWGSRTQRIGHGQPGRRQGSGTVVEVSA